MTRWDLKRKVGPEYRLGWNSIQSPEVQQAVRAQEATLDGSTPSQLALLPTNHIAESVIAEYV